MMFRIMMFSEVINAVGGSALPIYKVLTLLDVVVDRIKTHIHCFVYFLFHVFVVNSIGYSVVGGHMGGQLWVYQFSEGDSYWHTLFAIVEQG